MLINDIYVKTKIPFVIIIDEWDCVIRNSVYFARRAIEWYDFSGFAVLLDRNIQKYQRIATVISPELDKYERANEKRRICETMDVPELTLFRYELEYRTGGLEGLKPKTVTALIY